MFEEVDAAEPTNVFVLGTGNFGTCLSYHLAGEKLQNQVLMYSRSQEVVDKINKEKVNPKYLSKYKLREKMSATTELSKENFENSHVILMCIPTPNLRSVLKQIKSYITEEHLLILANKGIEVETLDLPYDIIKDVLGEKIGKLAVYLSGPSFAVEVMNSQPTAVTVASKSIERAKWAQSVFHDPLFRVYTSDDVIGIEIAGALKNVIAIASGISTGCGYQMNTRAALLTRGLYEITKIGVHLGANPLTFLGLSGVGDLMLTASSEKSRNFTVGFRLGQGEQLDDILKNLGSVAEGVYSTKSAFELANKIEVETPIIFAVYQVLYEKKDVKDAVNELLSLDADKELRAIQRDINVNSPLPKSQNK
eukprot:gene11459-4623_t